jgi:hypothetical protein
MIVEVLAAGRPALARRDEALTRFEAFLEPGRLGLPEAMESQALIGQAVVGGLYEAIYNQILDGETASLPELVPDLVYCALVPYLGHRRAIAGSRAERDRRARFTTATPTPEAPDAPDSPDAADAPDAPDSDASERPGAGVT